MLKKKHVNARKEIITEVYCNKCGNKHSYSEAYFLKIKENVHYSGLCITFRAGYYSKVLSDGTEYNFSLCDACIAALFTTFKFPPETVELF